MPPASALFVSRAAICVVAMALVACAEGTTLGTLPAGSNADGGDGGEGDAPGEGGRLGDGGSSAGDGGNQGSPSSSSGNVTGATTGTSSSVASSSASTSSVSASASASSSTATASSSSSGGGPTDCDPLNPGPGCGASQHCFPTPDGATECGDAGNGQHYDPCDAHTDCAPTTLCVNFGDPVVCCQVMCRDFLDCPGIQDCYPFDEPMYDGDGAEIGICNDGWFDCIEP